ncbi:hypothetical protein [Psittacicella hinzii]|uniref:Uncharacterized protein n=1 Tax=Psittacicella hinzii TaxID=2028575 RepID=A0A3A1YKP5_9GAMM|nr:hypothetical protein [Psittacicella hinzii]RIY38752.1 hypothetical protein CKF58_03485 [Psittacicella hinzii]
MIKLFTSTLKRKSTWLLQGSLALASLGALAPAQAAYNYEPSKLSIEQLERNYSKLLQQNPQLIEQIKQYLFEYTQFGQNRDITTKEFLMQSSIFFGSLNNKYKLNNNVYTADPKVDQFAQLGATCLEFANRKARILETDKNHSCSFILAMYMLAGYQRDGVQTLAMLGVPTYVYYNVKEKGVDKASQAEMQTVKSFEKWNTFTLDFKPFIVDYNYFKNVGVDTVQKLFKVVLKP